MSRQSHASTTAAAERFALEAAFAWARALPGALGKAPKTNIPLGSGAV